MLHKRNVHTTTCDCEGLSATAQLAPVPALSSGTTENTNTYIYEHFQQQISER